MRNNTKTAKMGMIVPLLIAALVIQAKSADAYWRHGNYDRGHDRGGWDQRNYRHHHYPYGRSVVVLPHRSISIVFGNGRFYYGEGHFYRRNARDYVTVAAPIGAIVYSIPGGCNRVVYGGVSYYTYDDVYYRPVSGGYQVVEPPSVFESQPAAVYAAPSNRSQDAFTVNIPNANSGYTAVTLKRSGSGYVGPQGEFYAEFPPIEQLRAMYGK
jgi:hypothetical protein